ncbi:MAG: MFS transporter, partial [Candidatus Eremiobacteraeota bacterium]|nr:MFS transporter [Candidatus Eremiobacteraeota bacterium]
SIGNVVGIVTGFGLFGLMLVLPLFLQIVLNFDPWQTGLVLLPGAIATALSMPIAGNLVGRIDARWSIAFGLIGSGVSAWWLGSFSQQAGYWDIFWPRVLQGFTLGFLFVPLSTVTLAGIERSRLSNATGLGTLLRQLGGSFGIAILTTLLVWKEKHAFNSLTSNVSQAHYGVRQYLHSAASQSHALMQISGMLQKDAALISFNFLFRVSAIVFFCSVPLVLLLPKVTRRGVVASPAGD